MLAVARRVGRASAQRIRAAAREIDLAFRDGSALRARPDRIELLRLGPGGAVGDARTFAAEWCTWSDHRAAPGDPFRTSARLAPGDWVTAQPRALKRLNRTRAAGCAILALSDNLDPPEVLRRLFESATALPSDGVPILGLDAVTELVPTLVLGPAAAAALAKEPDRWLPSLEGRLAAAPEVTCILPERQVVPLRVAADTVRAACPPVPAPEPAEPNTDNDMPAPW